MTRTLATLEKRKRRARRTWMKMPAAADMTVPSRSIANVSCFKIRKKKLIEL